MFGFLSNNLFFKRFYNSLIIYPCPKNMKYSWNFGILAFLFLIIQLISGLILSMHYQSNVLDAFNSVEHIVRDINYGWFLCAIHSNVASFFFLFAYLYLIRGLYYQTYLRSRDLIWSIGISVYFLLMAFEFLGYVLLWGKIGNGSWYGIIISGISYIYIYRYIVACSNI